MPASPEDLLAFLENLGVATSTVDHPPLFTVEDSQALRGEIPGGHTKNLFVKDKKGKLFLLVLGEETDVDLKRVHQKIGAQGRVSFGSAELLEEVWGVKPGAVTPFGAINDREARVSVVLDAAMLGGTLTEGAHYYVDVLAGGGMAFFAHALAKRIVAREGLARRPDHPRAPGEPAVAGATGGLVRQPE